MTHLHPDDPPARSNLRSTLARRCLQLALMLFVLALVPTLLAFWGQRRAIVNAAWRDPADNIRAAAVAPDLALLSLAGVPDGQVLALSMDMAELETARALLAFSPDLTDAQRMNGWLWLARHYQGAEQAGRAAQAYRLAGVGAVLSADLPDLLRTQTLLVVGRQLIELHDKPSARLYLQQAALIAAYTPHLTAYHRRSLLEGLVPAILHAGGDRNDWDALAETVENGSDASGAIGGSPSATPGSWNDAPPDNDAALVLARDARRAAAAAWLTFSSAANQAGEETVAVAQQDARQALRQALLAEDAAVDRYTARDATNPPQPAAQETRLRWLLLKRRIAAGGAGVGLVPEWESSRGEVDAALTAAWADWLALQTDSEEAGLTFIYQRLPVDAARQAIVAAYWGLYPDAPVADLLPAARPISGFGRLRLTVLEPGTPPVVGWSE
ncbi:MAG: hypothetical protein JSV36_15725 [Anaerolineae bacterium]|nr:MAG: hypothetical protein JSV36_15725 [Anaerolineae bacterium]